LPGAGAVHHIKSDQSAVQQIAAYSITLGGLKAALASMPSTRGVSKN